MNAQKPHFSLLTWWLIAGWTAFSAAMFIVGWSWIVNTLRQKPSSASVKAILVRGIPLILVHLIWWTIIFLSTSLKRETLLCWWIGAPLVLGFAYLNLYFGYRRLRRMEEQESQKETPSNQDSREE